MIPVNHTQNRLQSIGLSDIICISTTHTWSVAGATARATSGHLSAWKKIKHAFPGDGKFVGFKLFPDCKKQQVLCPPGLQEEVSQQMSQLTYTMMVSTLY